MKQIVAVMLCILLTACATNHANPKNTHAEKKTKAAKTAQHASPKTAKPAAASKEPFPVVTIQQEIGTLGDTVVHFGESVGGGLVVMKGIENRPVPPMNYVKTPFKKAASEIAGAAQCSMATFPNYVFLYPQGYENLLGLSLENRIDATLAAKSVGMTFGAETPLYKAFTLLSTSVGATVVADNVLAEVHTGAVTLAEMPLSSALEATLKSSRMVPEAYQVESTPEYVFFYSGPPVPPRSTLIGAETVTPEDNAYLDTIVDLYTPAKPEDPTHYAVPSGAQPLRHVLDALSQQLGRTVVVAPGMEEFPVNPCALIRMRVRTALDLLIRQWPMPDFGYAMEGGQIVIRRNKG